MQLEYYWRLVTTFIALVFFAAAFLSIVHFGPIGVRGHCIETCPFAFLEDKNQGAFGQHISLTQHLTTAIPSIFGFSVIFMLLLVLYMSSDGFMSKKQKVGTILVPRIFERRHLPSQVQELFSSGVLHSRSY